MAYYLAFDGVDDYVTIQRISFAGDFSISAKFSVGGNPNENGIFLGSNDGARWLGVFNGSFQFKGSGSEFGVVLPVGNIIYTATVSRVDGLVTLTVDGVGSASKADTGLIYFDVLGRYRTSTASFSFKNGLYYLDFGERFYNPSSSGGTGSILPDDVGGNDGTLVNFTLPDAWVFYGAAGATYSITFDPATYTYTGADLSLLVSRSISFDEGNYSYSGVDLNLSASRNISLDAGDYAVTGNDISLLASRVLSFDSGSYAYTGNDLTLTYNPATGATYTLSFDTGNYLYTGNDLTTLANRKLTLNAGSYTYTGNDLTLTYTPATGATYFISLNAGSYIVSGNTINLAANRALLLDAGSYTLTGEPVTLATNRKLSLDAGSYAVTGNDADLIAHRSITLESGEYDYQGNPITLTYSGQIISLIDDYSVNYTNDFVTAGYANNYINAEFK